MNKKNIYIGVLIFLVIIITSGFFYYFQIRDIFGDDPVSKFLGIKSKLFIFENMNESLSEEIANGFEGQFDEAVQYIKEDSNDYLGWAVAGANKKAVNDYYGAEALYLEGLKRIENNTVLYSNLGDLYYHFIEDYEKAEEYYLKVIEFEPEIKSAYSLETYRELSVLYRVKFKDEDKAINILKFGLENNPENKDLLIYLANAYTKFNRNQEAKQIWIDLVATYPENDLYKKELEYLN